MDETGAYYTGWSKSERKTPIQDIINAYINAYIRRVDTMSASDPCSALREENVPSCTAWHTPATTLPLRLWKPCRACARLACQTRAQLEPGGRCASGSHSAETSPSVSLWQEQPGFPSFSLLQVSPVGDLWGGSCPGLCTCSPPSWWKTMRKSMFSPLPLWFHSS